MTNIALITAGQVAGIIVADMAFASGLGHEHAIELPDVSPVGPGWGYVAGEFVAPVAETPVIAPPHECTGLEFLRRFTAQQRIAIRTLAKTDMVADDFMRLLDATIAQSGVVNLVDPDTVLGVGYLAATLPAAGIDAGVVLG